MLGVITEQLKIMYDIVLIQINNENQILCCVKRKLTTRLAIDWDKPWTLIEIREYKDPNWVLIEACTFI